MTEHILATPQLELATATNVSHSHSGWRARESKGGGEQRLICSGKEKSELILLLVDAA